MTGKDRKGQERTERSGRYGRGWKNEKEKKQRDVKLYIAQDSVRWQEHKQLTGLYLFYID
jgi:hypothetical protein